MKVTQKNRIQNNIHCSFTTLNTIVTLLIYWLAFNSVCYLLFLCNELWNFLEISDTQMLRNSESYRCHQSDHKSNNCFCLDDISKLKFTVRSALVYDVEMHVTYEHMCARYLSIQFGSSSIGLMEVYTAFQSNWVTNLKTNRLFGCM